MPTLTVESGWAETISDHHDDMNLLLVGGEGAIKIVLLVKWTRIQGNLVSGTIELFARDRDGMPRLRQSEVIFPRPPNATAITQRLGIRRRDIFGPALLPGRNGNDTLHLEIEALRSHATRALGFMNLNPA
ncbi:hypothetical protein N7528_005815 [Penicillium herquei]|nr:hypothetical protein N7528_005815 [Penicillium herquei]